MLYEDVTSASFLLKRRIWLAVDNEFERLYFALLAGVEQEE